MLDVAVVATVLLGAVRVVVAMVMRHVMMVRVMGVMAGVVLEGVGLGDVLSGLLGARLGAEGARVPAAPAVRVLPALLLLLVRLLLLERGNHDFDGRPRELECLFN